MKHIPLDIYDEMPKHMKIYISNYGWHFNKEAYEYAVSFINNLSIKNNAVDKIIGYTKEEVDNLLQAYGVVLDNKILHDYVYIATMCKANFLNKSIIDEYHLCLYIKDYVDNSNYSTETIFREWVATMVGNGCPIDWKELC